MIESSTPIQNERTALGAVERKPLVSPIRIAKPDSPRFLPLLFIAGKGKARPNGNGRIPQNPQV
jgi:hypothetical protein